MEDSSDAQMFPYLPSPPFISIPGINNFRDLGGYYVPSSPSIHSIRRHYIYRCGEPSRVTEDGIKILQSLPVSHVYDLRSKNEIERNKTVGFGGVKEWNGCQRVFVPVFRDMDYRPEKVALRYKDYASESTEGFTRAYYDILESAPPSYRKILLHIANEPSKPLIIHCTAGKDRTGVICALILSLCGVEDEVVAYEYSLTEAGLAESKEKLVAHSLSNPALNDNRKGALNMISAKAENMIATLGMIRDKFGGPEKYFIEKCGLSVEDIRNIRANLVVDESPVYQALQYP